MSEKPKAVHYCPPGPDWLWIGNAKHAPHFPVCCSGERARIIRALNMATSVFGDVTCKRCIAKLASLQGERR